MSEGQDQTTNITGDYHQTGDNVQGGKNIRLEPNAIQVESSQMTGLLNSGEIASQGGPIIGQQHNHTYYQTSTPKPYDPEYISWKRERENLIATVYQHWIEGYLKQAIHQEIYLFLGMEYKRDAVDRPWHLHLLPQNEPVPPDQTLLQIFEKYGRSLLILGEPGSGKTITLLQLAEQLLSAAQKDENQPVPVVLNLSSWAREREPLINWIIKEVDFQYNMARPVVKDWIEKRRLVFLLDGLDEVLAEHRLSCLRVINEFISETPAEVVVCSRREDYSQLQRRVRLKIAIYIEPLAPAQIDQYLTQFGSQVENIRHMLATDEDLQELAQSPLMLSLLVITYAGNKYGVIPADVPAEQKQQHLFSAYVQRMFEHRPVQQNASYSQTEALGWLIGIAYGLYASGETVFYIEKLQPSWLKKPQNPQWLAMILIGLLGGLIPFVFYGVLVNSSIAISFGLMSALISLMLSYPHTKEVELHEQIQFVSPSFSHFKDSLFQARDTFSGVGVIVVVVTGLFLGSYNAYFNWGTQPASVLVFQSFLTAFVFAMLIFYIGTPIWMFLTAFLKTGEKATREQNNRGILNSLKNSILIFLPTALFIALLIGGGSFYFSKPSELQLGISIVIGSFLGWVYFVKGFSQFGGASFILHYLVRYFLAKEKQFPYPFKDKHYLADMKDKLFLRQVGEGWFFIHKYLLEYLASQHPEYATNWQTHQKVGERYFEQEKYDEAIKAYREAIIINDKNSYLFNQLGDNYYELKQYEEAISVYKEAINLDSEKAIFYNNLGRAYHQLKQYEEAISSYQRAIKIEPQLVYLQINLGVTYYVSKQYDYAVSAYQRAIEIESKLGDLHNILGDTYYALRQYDKAIVAYQKAIEIEPQLAYLHNNLGDTYYALKQYVQAIVAYQKAINLDSEKAIFYNNLGRAHHQLKQYKEAISAYQRAIEIGPQLAYLHNNLGVTYYASKQYDHAVFAYEKAINLDSEKAIFYNNLGGTYHELKQYEEAISAYQRAIEIEPQLAYLHNNLGDNYYASKQYDQAIVAYQRVIELEDQNAVFYNYLGGIYRMLKQYHAAIKVYQKAISLEPDWDEPYIELGAIYSIQKNYRDAFPIYEKLVKIPPEDFYSYIRFADICYELGEMEKHQQALEDARKFSEDLISIDNQARLEAVTRNKENALNLLALVIQESGENIKWVLGEPDFYSLHDDPRFWELVGGKSDEGENKEG